LAEISKIFFYKTACMLALLLDRDVHENVLGFLSIRKSGEFFYGRTIWEKYFEIYLH
jgi:hypothetical protein